MFSAFILLVLIRTDSTDTANTAALSAETEMETGGSSSRNVELCSEQTSQQSTNTRHQARSGEMKMCKTNFVVSTPPRDRRLAGLVLVSDVAQ